MYKYKDRCKKCVYGWLPNGHPSSFVQQPMCLFYHDTAKHRDGDDETCNSFKELTEEEIRERKEENFRRSQLAKESLFY